jgi:protein required for attachment to host cells
MLTSIPETLIAVFDGAKARFFRLRQHGKLEAVQTAISDLRHSTQDSVSDKPGRGFASAGGGLRHSFESKHDPHKMEKHDFVHAIVTALEDVYDRGAFERLMIVAPARSIGEFRSLAPEKLSRLIWREVPKELMHLSNHDLEIQLAPYLTSLEGPSRPS